MRDVTENGAARPAVLSTLTAVVLAATVALATGAEAVAQTSAQRLKLLEQTVKELLERDEARERKMKAMQAELKRLRKSRGLATVTRGDKPAQMGHDDHDHDHGKKKEKKADDMHAGDGHGHDHKAGEDSAEHADDHATDVWSARVGDGVLRLSRLGLDVDFAAGGGTAKGEDMASLFGGHHDPNRTGFTLQSAELSIAGSFDPYFDAFFGAALSLDSEGETGLEIEETWVRSKWLGDGSIRLKAGQFLTPFGAVNRSHLHDWAWQTQPIVATRVFGGDGARGLGAEAEMRFANNGPWRTTLFLSLQNRRSLHAHSHGHGAGDAHEEDAHEEEEHDAHEEDEHDAHEEDEHDAHEEDEHDAHEEDEHDAHEEDEEYAHEDDAHAAEDGSDADGLEDFAFAIRLENQLTMSPRTSLTVGGSAMFEPNPNGDDSRVSIFGVDVTARHRLPSKDRIVLSAEYMHRNARAAAEPEHHGEEEEDEHHHDEMIRVQDYGFYLQGIWYTPDGWGVGLRYEQAGSRGGDAEARAADPMRGNRTRISPLLLWQFSELGRLKLQYNYDRADFLENRHAHSVFLSANWSFGLGAPDHSGHSH